MSFNIEAESDIEGIDVPCFLDPKTNCPKSCRLRLALYHTYREVAQVTEVDYQEHIDYLRYSRPAFYLAQRARNSLYLKDQGLIENCYQYPEADIL